MNLTGKKDNRLRNHLLTCRHPRVIENKRGVPVLSSCGKCPECLSRKSKRNTMLAIQESKDNMYSAFVTLTYNNSNVPKLKIFENRYTFRDVCYKLGDNHFLHTRPKDKIYLSFVDYTARKLHPNIKKSPIRKSKNYGKCIFRVDKTINNPLIKKLLKKTSPKSSLYGRLPYRTIPVLCKDDLQKFIKRLRFHIGKDFNCDIRYFACGEYGPQSYRPHYHLEIFFNEPRLKTELQGYINKCWQYGTSYCEPTLSCNGVASYAAGYLNGSANLPSFYNNKQIAPFVLHSTFFGSLTDDEVVRYVRAFDRFPFEPFTISTSSGIRDISLQSKIKSHLFPRCYDYEHKISLLDSKLFESFREKTFNESTREFADYGVTNDFFNLSLFKQSEFYKLYNLFPYLSRKYETTHLMDLSRYFLLYEDSNFDLLDLFSYTLKSEVTIDDELKPILERKILFDKSQFELAKEELDDIHLSFLMRVYNALLVSRRVYNNSLMCDLSLHEYLYKLIQFYNQLEQYKLKQQYELQQQYHDEFCADDYSIFYYINKDSTTDYEDLFHNNRNIEQYKVESFIEIQNKVKHKELNDANEIFTNL